MAPESHAESTKTSAAKKARQSKKPRDMPTRPLSAYNFFFREQRAKILEEREEEATRTGQAPDKSDLFAILGKTIAARWKAQDEDQRAKYKKMAQDDMKRYRVEMDQYHETIAKSIRVEDKIAKKKSKKASKKAAASENGSHEGKPKGRAVPSPRQGAPPGAPTPAMMQHMNVGSPSMAAMRPGLEGATMHDMAAYQNLLRERQIAALREQQMGFHPGLGPQGHMSMDMLRGGMGAGLGLMDRSLGAGGPPPGFMGSPPPGLFSVAGAPGMIPQGYATGSMAYPGLDMPWSSEMARSSLTPEEQLYLLRRNQEDADNSIRRRLELMQQERAREMQLASMQGPLPPSGMSMMQERQIMMERQRMQQLLAGQGGPPPPTAGY
uniref:HMG box domain-containing protein n=1 Tax=Amphora coffeiformis TaxID=265554 RepID=A0A7S3LF74_9STRA|mmetsp:Transcript_25018/g.47498  ORF Transcript_25018/g.47498 Transcript_25018/m.47498 type:complete len:380 (+) Transcript_25018:253-1392(+)|eukprot:scaffold2500_cov176-Amphora_coffeaeformis.AAC.15